jgi:hypothetical protein
MMHHWITTAFLLGLWSHLLAAAPADPQPKPTQVGDRCGTYDGEFLGDCAGTLTCIPLSTNCTRFHTNWTTGCPGTCQEIDLSQQRIYTLCGGWHLYDDCDERVERCRTDPRNFGCGPACDGPGICIPKQDTCRDGQGCREGLACFETGDCLPLRFGSSTYPKTSQEEVWGDDDEWTRTEDGLENQIP